MSGESTQNLSDQDIREIVDAFNSAITKLPADPRTKAPLGGVNIRLNAAKLFEAAWTAVKIWGKVHIAAATAGLTLIDGMELAGDSFAFVTTALDAIRQETTADAYVACVVLGSAPEGLTEADFEAAVRKFLANPSSKPFPWYLGLTKKRLAHAAQALSAKDSFGNLISYLRNNRWIDDIAGGKVKIHPQNFTWGLNKD